MVDLRDDEWDEEYPFRPDSIRPGGPPAPPGKSKFGDDPVYDCVVILAACLIIYLLGRWWLL